MMDTTTRMQENARPAAEEIVAGLREQGHVVVMREGILCQWQIFVLASESVEAPKSTLISGYICPTSGLLGLVEVHDDSFARGPVKLRVEFNFHRFERNQRGGFVRRTKNVARVLREARQFCTKVDEDAISRMREIEKERRERNRQDRKDRELEKVARASEIRALVNALLEANVPVPAEAARLVGRVMDGE